MKVALLVHGMLTGDAEKSGIAQLAPFFQAAGYETVIVDYGWAFIARMKLANGPVAQTIASFAKHLAARGDEVVAAGHSNGAPILCEATRHGAPIKVLAAINGAIGSRPKVGLSLGYLLNYHSPGDKVLALAVLVPGIGGQGGQWGFPKNSPDDFWNKNVETEYGARGHHGVFQPEVIGKFGPDLVRDIEHFRKAA